MQAYTWDKIASEQLDARVARRMIVGEKEMLVRWEFQPGALAARHSHPHEQVVFMVQGKLRLAVGDEEKVLGAHDIVVIPPNVPHEAEALDYTVVIDIFSPPREDFIAGGTPAYLRK